ncbi:MAG: galactose mutarotase, partial [Puniceicoccales bacterium]|nr:galactose mutarotase [Puniceicoccales bacterium]
MSAPTTHNTHATDGTAAPVTAEKWGRLPDGRAVTLYTLDNGQGLRVRIANYGAIIVSVETPDKTGAVADVALGYANIEGYLNDPGTYFGAVVGRVANRIAAGKFTLDGIAHTLATNNTPAGIPCSLHGGKTGFDKVLWDAKPADGKHPALTLTYRSKDGEEGYAGNLDVTVTYTVLPCNTLRVDYAATTDKATPVNLSQHSYFNLSGEGNGTILDHQIRFAASRFTPVNAGLIPTGEVRAVAGTPFDFTQPHAIGERIGAVDEQLAFGAGYDHNWALDPAPDGTDATAPRFAAEV